MDSRLRGNDRHLDRFVIPAKAGIQALLPGLIEKLLMMLLIACNKTENIDRDKDNSAPKEKQ